LQGKKIIFGLVLIFVGFALISRATGLIDFTVGDLFGVIIPVGLIMIGIWLIVRRSRPREPERGSYSFQYGEEPQTDQTPGSSTTFEKTYTTGTQTGPDTARAEGYTTTGSTSYGRQKFEKFFGDIYVDCEGRDLQNLEVSVFIGDCEVKIHGGKLSPGLNRMVVSGFIGDVRVLVPKGMPVFAQCSNFVGDIELLGRRTSGFGNNIDGQTPNYSTSEDKLYIASNFFIGDIHIYEV